MTRLIALSGSLRQNSFNSALLRNAADLAPDDVHVELASLHGIPLYDGDLEAREGVPSTVTALGQAIAGADGLIIASPEYNNGIPGVLKNGIDWLSRIPADQGPILRDRPVALAGATPGGFGTVLAQTAWLPVLRALGLRLWTGGRLTVAGAARVFDEDGRLTDGDLRERVQAFVTGFAAFARPDDAPH